MRRPLLASLALLGLMGAPAPLQAQLPPLTVPKGYVRFDIGGHFMGYDERYLLGQRQGAAGDFIREAIGSDFFPAIAGIDSLVQQVTGLASPISLGRTSATQLVSIGTGLIGAAIGITNRLTVFGTIPIRLVQVRASLAQDSATANAGFNPADPLFGDGAGAGQDALFFSQFDEALAALETNLGDGVYDGDPARKALAEATLASGGGLRTDLFALLLGSGSNAPFLPTRSSTAGAAILQRIAALQQVLSNRLDVSGFSSEPALPSQRLDNTGFDRFVTQPQGPVAGSLDSPQLVALGDVELGAAYSLVDQLSRPGGGMGVRVAAQLLTRLRTSQLDDPNRFFDVGTGDRQPDIEGSVAADFSFRRFGGRLTGGYNLQLAGNAQRRISLPSQPIAYASTLAGVSRTPGNEVILGAMPFYRITPTFSVVAGATYRTKGTDRYGLVAGQDSIPGAPPELLAVESDASWMTASAGLSYSAALTPREGRSAQAPLDAGLIWEGVIGASGGRVPRSSGIRLWLRYYARFW